MPLPLIPIALALAQFVPQILPLFRSRKANQVAEVVTNIAQAITGRDTPDEALETLKADPALVLQYQQAVLAQKTELERIAADKEVSMREMDVAETKAFLGDVQSAREHGDQATTWMSYLVTLGFFGMVTGLLFIDIPDGNREVVYLLAGTLTTAWVAVINYRFGSSRGSSLKQQVIEQEILNRVGRNPLP